MSQPPTPNSRFFSALVVTAVPLASFLSFSVQPIVGKYLVPWHGGAASTWIAAMLYFQAALVLGYAWAYYLGSRTIKSQVWATLILAVCAGALTQLPPPRILGAFHPLDVLLSLTLALLPGLILLFSTGILLQGWLRQVHGQVPYHLYAVSNLGSLVSLAFYPIWIEPNLRLGTQAIIWRILLGALIVVLALLAWQMTRVTATRPVRNDTLPAEHISIGRKATWLCLSALTCTCMLGATQQLSAEIGSNPLSWILPLGLYLGSFSLTFTGWWREGATQMSVGVLAISLSGYVLLKGIASEPIIGWPAIWLLLGVGSASCLGTAVLYALRPREQFHQFYLIIGLGGMIGGIFCSLSAPNLLTRNYEFLAAETLLLISGLVYLWRPRSWLPAAVTAIVVLAPVIGTVWKQAAAETANGGKIYHLRNLYGHVLLMQRPGLVTLRSETTTHGAQVITSEAAKRRPTMYYVESSAVGIAVRRVQEEKPSVRVAVVGLGAGTLAAYSRNGDKFIFWDIDPKVIRLARIGFSYITDAAGEIAVKEEDGRQGLAAIGEGFDLVVVDAFTGDAIPTHLLTLEAMRIYLARLTQPGGVLMIHASNRFMDLFPVIAGNARALGMEAMRVKTEVHRAARDRDYFPASNTYVFVCPAERLAEIEGWLPLEEDSGRVKRTVTRLEADDPALIRWTDELHSIRDVLTDNWIFGIDS